MSALIKGMEMPKGCAFCKIPMRNGKKMNCPLVRCEWDLRDPMSADHRLDGCPLVELPPHGRLIDAEDRKSTRLNSSHAKTSSMPSSA